VGIGRPATNSIAKYGITDRALARPPRCPPDRHRTPAEHVQASSSAIRSDQFDRLRPFVGVDRQERDAGGISVGTGFGARRPREADLGTQQIVRKLEQDAGAVAAGGFGTGRATVLNGERVSASDTIWCDLRPWMSATMATPQLTLCGSGRTGLRAGMAEEDHSQPPRRPVNLGP